MRLLHPREVAAGRLHYHKGGLTGELSDLGIRAGEWPQRSDQVYDDSCDYGLTVVGRTHSVVYAVTEEDHNHEGELVAWHLEPAKGEVRRVPACRGVKLVLFND